MFPFLLVSQGLYVDETYDRVRPEQSNRPATNPEKNSRVIAFV